MSDMPTAKVVLITPKVAKEWLATNEQNRKVSWRVVLKYASDMKAGAWKLNGESIKLDEDGRLIDGQHRLMAIVESDCPVNIYVVFGLARGDRDTIDCGKTRSLADRLTLNGYPNGRLLASRAAVILLLEKDERSFYPHSLREVKECVDRHNAALSWSIETLSGSGIFGPAQIAGTLAYCWPSGREVIDTLARRMKDGVGLQRGAPALVLRGYILRRGRREFGGSDNRMETVAATLRCARAAIAGDDIGLLKPSTLLGSVFTEMAAFFGMAHKRHLGSEPGSGLYRVSQ